MKGKHQDHNSYVHSYVNNLIDKFQHYSIGNTRKALSVAYYKSLSSTDHDSDTKIEHKKFNSKYNLYHFLPVIDMTSFTPMTQIDLNKQGYNQSSQATIIIQGIKKPSINDMVEFYISNSVGLNNQQKELFKVTDVQFFKTSGKLNTYQLQIESSGLSPKDLMVTASAFYFDETRRWYPIKYINFYQYLKDKKYIDIQKYYDSRHGYYFHEDLPQETNLKLNQTLKWIKTLNSENLTALNPIFHKAIVVDFDNPFYEKPTGLGLTKEDVWFKIDGYEVPTDPNYIWKWTDGKKENPFAKIVWDLAKVYDIFYTDYTIQDPDNTSDDNDMLFNEIMDLTEFTHEINKG